ncbi:MAG: CpaF/VirB11 family protein, partial [Candidatus Nanohaloarchaea archaeon]|nr:CpaF/VirB11 family protein [Candidatus Nanohaloarchaea archaeon]
SIEDTRELQLPHENWIPSVTRSAAGDQQDDITMYELLRESFRQNPDYVVVGEVRGKEASVLFQGMASGHPSLSTMHASNPADVVSRLTTPPINLSPALVETLDIIVSMTHAREWGENARRVQAVYEIEDISDEGSARTNQYFSWTSVDDSFSQKADSTVMDNIQQQFGLDTREIEQEMEDRKRVLEWLHENGYTHFEKVSSVISEYYKDKDTVMEMVSEDTGVGFEEIADTADQEMPPEIERERAELEQTTSHVSASEDASTPESEEPGEPAPAGPAAATGEEDAAPAGEPGAPGVDYDALVDNPVHTVRERVDREGIDPEAVLQAEKSGRNREELTRWLRGKIERRDLEQREEEPGAEETAAVDAGDEEDLFGEEDEELVENPFEQ